MTSEAPPPTGIALMRAPFPAHQISKLPKETKKQAADRKADQDAGRWPDKCGVCEGYHHKNAVHLDYVGHAALTDRLLDCDPEWSWEPVSFDERGLPAKDATGGLWIRLTVAGVTRLGYGHADGKSGGDAVKEAIGDALRNAAMRFGAALDLWHKGDLHVAADDGDAEPAPEKPTAPVAPVAAINAPKTLAERADTVEAVLKAQTTPDALAKAWAKASALCAELDLKDPERLVSLTSTWEGLRDEMDANPFAREAA